MEHGTHRNALKYIHEHCYKFEISTKLIDVHYIGQTWNYQLGKMFLFQLIYQNVHHLCNADENRYMGDFKWIFEWIYFSISIPFLMYYYSISTTVLFQKQITMYKKKIRFECHFVSHAPNLIRVFFSVIYLSGGSIAMLHIFCMCLCVCLYFAHVYNTGNNFHWNRETDTHTHTHTHTDFSLSKIN